MTKFNFSIKKNSNPKNHLHLRINIFFFGVFIIFSILLIQLTVLQFVEGPVMAEQENISVTRTAPLLPVRGTIYDSTGQTKLAYSEPSYSLYITLFKNYSEQSGGSPNPNRKEILELAEKLSKVFQQLKNINTADYSVEQIIEAMDLEYKQALGYTPRLIKSGLSNQEVAYFMENKMEYPGVSVVEETIRKYDPDTIAVQAIGYLKSFKTSKTTVKYKELDRLNAEQTDPGLIYSELEDVGVSGLEMQYQDLLRGKNGFKQIAINAVNLPEEGSLPVTQPPIKGYDLVSTLNKTVQMKTEQAIIDQLQWLQRTPVSGKLHPNAKTGYAVAMEVETGNIIAMASMPDYDPNAPWDYEKIKYIYRNGTVESFPPNDSGQHPESTVLLGSTIKPLSVLIGLNEGLITPGTTYMDQGYAEFGRDNSRVRNSGGKAFGLLTPVTAIKNSSNAFMVDLIGEQLWRKYADQSVEVWDKYMKEFGLGVETGVDLPREFRGRIEYNQKNQSQLSSMAFASFGQQGKYTALQLAQYTVMLANKGKRMEPHLVKEIRDTNGSVIQTIEPKILNEVSYEDELWQTIHRGMATNVDSAFQGFPYDFARKTGTSQQTIYKNGQAINVENGVFIAFAPRENPKLVVAVVVPEGGYGSQSAAPIARKIFDAYDAVFGLTMSPQS
ncbi:MULTISPECIES: peptidoglycan D,D-transpeptidase FtsI family protein [unclassified Paenibacillus]|uniref:peptidoglycan D,D-transpeptidase FtsI family protein n=1 Tax=unclassified Paenibacillus TaxID=185978 RepID=UPI000BA07C68|nr:MULTISPECIES: penicillin-binding transpeptidase domain-containing protein [unclassified Paenibacillus]MBY3621302.1 penicillin-binding protein 2 [Acinetobacter sp. CUI P1]MDH6373105.1 cell division protein FtsI/penicillin-binding protein 2 [Paenibacillus sp. PastF-3]OZQ97536.1 cell division protein FtsI [Paenibacillus sp. VTT E-133291]